MELLQRTDRNRGLGPDGVIFSGLDGPDSKCSSRWAVFLEAFRYDHTGRCARLGGLPVARLNVPPMFSTIGHCGDSALLVVVGAKPASDPESYAAWWNAVRRSTDARLHDLGIRAENLGDGRFRPGLLLDPDGAPDLPVRHPRAVIDGARIDSRLYFSPVPLLTPEEWRERASAISPLPPVALPSPPRPRNFIHRMFHGGLNR